MKELGKMFGWLKVSNRPAHAKMGFIVFALTLLFSLALMTFAAADIGQNLADRLMIVNLLQADFCVFGCMCAVEFTQHFLCKVGKFDWLDIAAGFLIPFVLTIILTLVILIV